MDLFKYVPLHSVLFAAWITGAVVFGAQIYLPKARLSEWHLENVEVAHIPIGALTLFCLILWIPARRSARSRLHVPDSLIDNPKGR